MSEKAKKIICGTVFAIYIVAVFYFPLFYQLDFGFVKSVYNDLSLARLYMLEQVNYIPFRFIFNASFYTPLSWCIKVFGNLLFFAPAPFFTRYLFEDFKECKVIRYMIFMAEITITIELGQWLLLCPCDIDDVILKLVGTLISFFIAKKVIK